MEKNINIMGGRERHVMRNLFRQISDDSSSSSSSSSTEGGDNVYVAGNNNNRLPEATADVVTTRNDNNNSNHVMQNHNDIKSSLSSVSVSSLFPQTKTTATQITTIVQRVQHVDLEVCTMGGSIEHRLWPAAEFLTSYILYHHQPQQSKNSDDTGHTHAETELPYQTTRFRANTRHNIVYQHIYQNTQTILDRFRSSMILSKMTTTSNDIERQQQQQPQTHHHSMMSESVQAEVVEPKPLKVIELGAGVGFTTLELAYHVFTSIFLESDGTTTDQTTTYDNNSTGVQFLMTDLKSALPMLRQNQQRNGIGKHDCYSSHVQVQKLEWGNQQDIENAVSWYNNRTSINDNNSTCSIGNDTPLLILGTDCVYWESLHDVLETTIASLLQNATPNSICLLANVRRWKRDTNFFQRKNFGQFSSNSTGQLHCICIHEHVSRKKIENRTNGSVNNASCNIDLPTPCDFTGSDGQLSEGREVLRIYAIQWMTK